MLDQPVDRVPRVGRVIDRTSIERTPNRERDDIVAARSEFSADVLKRKNVAVAGRFRVAEGHNLSERRLPQIQLPFRAIWSAVQENREIPRAARKENDRVQGDAVARGDVDNPGLVI